MGTGYSTSTLRNTNSALPAFNIPTCTYICSTLSHIYAHTCIPLSVKPVQNLWPIEVHRRH